MLLLHAVKVKSLYWGADTKVGLLKMTFSVNTLIP